MTEARFKGLVHAVAAVMFGMPLGYNLMRLASTRKLRNGINVALYGTAVTWELVQVHHHWTEEGHDGIQT